MIIIYFIICIVLFYYIYKYICKNLNYSKFEHFYNNELDLLNLSPDLIYNTIIASNNSFEGFNKLDISNNPSKKLKDTKNMYPNLISNYLYSTPNNSINVSPYWYNPLDYWLNPYVYYNWYGSSTSYSSPVINTHRRHIRSSGHSGSRRHSGSRKRK